MEQRANAPRLHHRGHVFQVPIYFGKLLRSFIYLNDWKMLPMAAVIAALVSMVIRRDFFLTMEGTMKGAFSLTCVGIWNGCFNSIQVICRERAIIKREHRSGMHVGSYVVSHMMYQALLCLGQTVVTLIVCKMSGVKFIKTGAITGIGMLDIGVTLFLITYASDMISLFVSSIAHSTTSAMTVMPFVLIFQFIFSGGMFSMPAWTESISQYTLSHYGLVCFSAQADYNSLPMVTGWNTILKMENREVSGSLTLGQIIDLASSEGVLKGSRQTMLIDDEVLISALGDVAGLKLSETAPLLAPEYATEDSLEAIEAIEKLSALAQEHDGLLLGDLIDVLGNTKWIQELRDTKIPYRFTIAEVIDAYGRDKLKDTVQTANALAMQKDSYVNTSDNILYCWFMMLVFSAVFAFGCMVSLKFIDKDKR